MKNICEWENCKFTGEFKAPAERDNIKNYFKKNEINKIVSFMKKDKKNLNDKINLILLKSIGETTKPNSLFITTKELQKFLASCYI